MDRKQLLKQVGPCGQDCGRCLNNPGSPVSRNAQELWRSLDRFGALAGWRAGLDVAFVDYAAFERVLARFAGGGCVGCRSGACPAAGCKVRDCILERGVDFCHECPDFPCTKTDLPHALRERWLINNERIRDVGLEVYYGEMRSEQR